jgi:O-antigen ligase
MFDPLFHNDYYFSGFVSALIVTIILLKPLSTLVIRITELDFLFVSFISYYVFNICNQTATVVTPYDFYFLCCYVLIYFAIKFFQDHASSQQIRSLIIALLIIFVGEVAIELLQFFGIGKGKNSFFNVSGSFISPAVLTNFLCIAFPLLNNFLKDKGLLAWSHVLFLTLCLACFLTDSKLSWLVVGVLLLLKATPYLTRYPKISYGSLGVVFLCIILAILFQDSTSGRFLVLENSLSLWQEHFFAGVGVNQFERVYNLFQADFISKHANPEYSYFASYIEVAYNDFLQIAIEMGFFGLVLMGLVAFVMVRNFKRYPSYIREALIVIFLVAFFSFPFQTSSTATLCVVYLGIASSFHEPVKQFYIHPTVVKMLCTLSLGIVMVLSFNIQNALYVWQLSGKNPDVLTQSRFESARYVLTNNKNFQLAYGNMLFLRKKSHESINVLEKLSAQSSKIDIFLLLALNYEAIADTSAAERNFRKSISLVPSLLRPKFLLMKFYLKNRRLQEAKAIATIITTSRIKVKTMEATKLVQMANEVLKL